MSMWDELALSRAHEENELRQRVTRNNTLIVGVVEALLTHARTVDWKAELKEKVNTAVSKTDYEVTLLHFTRIKWDYSQEFEGTWEDRQEAYRIAEREDTKISHLPVKVSADAAGSHGDQWSLSEIFNYKYLTLPLLSLYLGKNLKVVTRVGDVFYSVPSLFEARHARLVIKYFPRGLPLGEAIPLNQAKQFWGVKTTPEELAAGGRVWGGADDAATEVVDT